MLRPLQPISNGARVVLGVSFFVLFVAGWAFATLGGYVPKIFLADPLTMLVNGWELLTRYGFLEDIGMTVWRVVGGFRAGCDRRRTARHRHGGVEAGGGVFRALRLFARYLPASAFIPLLILWAGLGEMQKLLVIFIGSVFQIVLMVAGAVGGTRRDLVEAAYTLGAQPSGHRAPGARAGERAGDREILRLVLGWAWTYVIVAELIGSSTGIGHMIIESKALMATGQIIFGIIVIGLIGLVSDFAFKAANRALFPWRLA